MQKKKERKKRKKRMSQKGFLISLYITFGGTASRFQMDVSSTGDPAGLNFKFATCEDGKARLAEGRWDCCRSI